MSEETITTYEFELNEVQRQELVEALTETYKPYMMKIEGPLTEAFSSGLYFVDPAELSDDEDIIEGLRKGDYELWMGSYGGSYWPNIYFSIVEKHSVEETFCQHVFNMFDTPEGYLHLLSDPEDLAEAIVTFEGEENLRRHTGYGDGDGLYYSPEDPEFVRLCTEEEVEMFLNCKVLMFQNQD